MAVDFLDVCRFVPTLGGTTDWVVSSAATGYQTPASAGAVDGATYRYRAESTDLSQWEEGYGAYTVSSTTLSRTTVTASSTGSKVNFTTAPQVAITIFSQDLKALAYLSGRNRIINGSFAVDQRGGGAETAAITTTAYCGDRWKFLGADNNGKFKGNDTTINGAGGTPNGYVKCVTANTKYGLIQYIEGINCTDLWGQAVTVQAKIKTSAGTLTNVKIGIIEWSSTQDTITSNPISAWGAAGTNPTLAANFTFKNTPANVSPTTTATKFTVSATLSSSFTNLAVMIWSDGANSANDIFYVTDVQLEAGSVATPFEHMNPGIRLALCQRYYEKSWAQGTAPATAWSQADGTGYLLSGAAGLLDGTISFKTVKRLTPTVTTYDRVPTAGKITIYNGSAWVDGDAPTVTAKDHQFVCSPSAAAQIASIAWVASAEL